MWISYVTAAGFKGRHKKVTHVRASLRFRGKENKKSPMLRFLEFGGLSHDIVSGVWKEEARVFKC